MSVSQRLKYARKRANLTLAQVEERTAIGKSSVSDFENGRRDPKLRHLHALAETYRRSVGFFLSEGPLPKELVLWRERPAEGPEELEADFLRLCEQYHNLEVWCEEATESWLPEPDMPAERFGYAQAEELAQGVRGQLQLGDRPGQELLRVLEEACGVKVFHRGFHPTGTAASTKSPNYGYAVLLNANNIRWRRNFDLAHELFHLLTWKVFRDAEEDTSCVASEKEESLATCFARNLLMPENALRTALDRRTKEGSISFESLFDVAREFDVSVEALLWGAHFLYNRGPEAAEDTKRDIERAESLRSLYEEREDTRPPKWPRRYHALAVKALRHGEISIGRFAQYLEISRQKAMSYIEREIEEDEKVQIAPARC
jgi:Zn-dependent peptidase ImmA (M78 family)/DNA-binding XRE family transcriptional regulator